MIRFIKNFFHFRKDLTKILSVFDKAQRELDDYISHTAVSLEAATAAAEAHLNNLTTAKTVKGNLAALTSK